MHHGNWELKPHPGNFTKRISSLNLKTEMWFSVKIKRLLTVILFILLFYLGNFYQIKMLEKFWWSLSSTYQYIKLSATASQTKWLLLLAGRAGNATSQWPLRSGMEGKGVSHWKRGKQVFFQPYWRNCLQKKTHYAGTPFGYLSKEFTKSISRVCLEVFFKLSFQHQGHRAAPWVSEPLSPQTGELTQLKPSKISS